MSLAIECGATSSVVVYVAPEVEGTDIQYEQTTRFHYGPANYKLLKPLELERFFRTIHDEIDKPAVRSLAVAMPGILNDFDRKVSLFFVTQIHHIHLFSLSESKDSFRQNLARYPERLGGQRP